MSQLQPDLISMDGRGRCIDNGFIERLWRSPERETVYLTEIANGLHAGPVIQGWIYFCNGEHPHAAPRRRTPDESYEGQVVESLAA